MGYQKVKKIKKIQFDEEHVYNLHIKNDHNYIAEGAVVSNCHLLRGKELSNIFELCINAEYRIGTTGTLDNCRANISTIIGHTGAINKLNTTKELMDKGQISKFKIKCLILDYDKETSYAIKKYKYQDEIKYLVTNNTRNIFIKNLALSLKNNTIILCNYIEHMKTLHEMLLNSKHLNGRNVYLVYGAVEGKERERIRNIVETDKDAIIVASSQVMSTGTNIKSLHNIIFAINGKSTIRILQSIGRALRLHADKDCAVIYDIVDDLSIKSHRNFSLLHFMERVKIYNKEQFDYKLVKIPFHINT